MSRKARKALRVIGGLCLGGALIVGLAWRDTAARTTSVDEKSTLQSGRTTSIFFTPAIEDTSYTINLQFEDTQQLSLNCSDISLLGIQWAIISGGKALASGDLSSNSKDRDFSCDSAEGFTNVSLFAPELKINQQHVLQLSVSNKSEIKTRVIIEAFGINVHYTFMDMAVLELLGGVLLIIGCSCLLPDLVSRLSWR